MKRLFLTCWLACTFAIGLLAQSEAGRIDFAEFQKLHAARQVVVVDVRDPQSFALGHIPGAINVPLGSEAQSPHLAKLRTSKQPIVTYCA